MTDIQGHSEHLIEKNCLYFLASSFLQVIEQEDYGLEIYRAALAGAAIPKGWPKQACKVTQKPQTSSAGKVSCKRSAQAAGRSLRGLVCPSPAAKRGRQDKRCRRAKLVKPKSETSEARQSCKPTRRAGR